MQYGKIVFQFTHNGKKIILRYPKLEDLKNLLSLINSLVKERAYISKKKKTSLKEELEWLLEKIKNIEEKKEIFLVVEVDNKIVGNIEIKKGQEKQEHIGYFGILLKKEARNRGIGQKIIPLIIKEAQKQLKIKMVVLDVVVENSLALHVYKKLGFQKTGELKKGVNHFGKYLTLVSMVKYL